MVRTVARRVVTVGGVLGATQEIEFNKININCRVHGESEERSFDAAPTALARAVRAR